MNKSKKLIFFGTETFSLETLRALVENNFDVVAVVTKPNSRKGRGRKLVAPAVKVYAENNSIPVIQNSDIKVLEEELRQLHPYAGVLSSFGRIIPSSMLAMFDGGIINVHPSLLPKYRGSSPIEQSILNGDNETGVSIMKLVEKMDAGPIYAQKTVSLSVVETSVNLYKKLANVGAQLLVDNLKDILDDGLKPKAQDERLATYAPTITKVDGRIDWSQPAEIIERQVRAYLGWPGSKTTIAEMEVTITKIAVIKGSGPVGSMETRNGVINVYCGKNILAILRLKPAGKREMSASQYLAGNKI